MTGRESAFRDVPEDSRVTSHLAGAPEGQKSFAVNVGHNLAPHVVLQESSGALLGLLGGLSVRGVDQRLRGGVRPLQRHRGGNPINVAKSGLFCVECEADGVEVVMVGKICSKNIYRGKKGAYGWIEREISIENRFFRRDFRKYLLRVFCEVLHVLLAIFKYIIIDNILTRSVK